MKFIIYNWVCSKAIEECFEEFGIKHNQVFDKESDLDVYAWAKKFFEKGFNVMISSRDDYA